VARSYSQRDLKLLWGANAKCAFPDCRAPLVAPATESDDAQVVGKIAHIVGHSDDGPRGDPDFPPSEREKPDNVLLLCGNHHDLVDVQPNTYTVDDLRRWKADHAAWAERALSEAVVALTFKELEQVSAALVSTPPGPPSDLTPPTPPAEKMSHNDLTHEIATYYQIGQLRFADIETFISDTSAWDPTFGARLKAGFQERYAELREKGLRGDDLYVALVNWASGGSADLPRQAAGVAIVSYLFHVCDIFDPVPQT